MLAGCTPADPYIIKSLEEEGLSNQAKNVLSLSSCRAPEYWLAPQTSTVDPYFILGRFM